MGRETTKGKIEMKLMHYVEPAPGGWAVKNDEETIGVLVSEDAARTLAESLNHEAGANSMTVYSRGRWEKEQRA